MTLRPTGIGALKRAAIGDPPDVIARPRFGDIVLVEPTAERMLEESDRLQDRAAAGAAAADIEDPTRAGAPEEFDEPTDEIARVNVVADLLAPMSDHIVSASSGHASREV